MALLPAAQVLTKALQLHPTASGLWSYAAAWEVEHHRNVAAARALMQRGLRMCRGDAQLWVEYFRLELLYAHTLRARRKVLGIDAAQGAQRAVCQRLLCNLKLAHSACCAAA